MYDLIIIGGGAAGVFASIAALKNHPNAKVRILEKTGALLSKVRLTGGGRCNVTNACFDPALLIQNYPRGGRELIGPFHKFQPKDTMEWFTAHGVILKTEAEGRVFPLSDSSESIVKCLITTAEKSGVEIALNQNIETLKPHNDHFEVTIEDKPLVTCRSVLLATGSSSEGYALAKALGHTIIPPIPSLFSFSVPSSPFSDQSGISVDPAEVKLIGTQFSQQGPLLITHRGFSGPVILKLSSFAARYLHECTYHAEISINWLPLLSEEAIYHQLVTLKKNAPQKTLESESLFGFSKGLWKAFLNLVDEISGRRINDISLRNLRALSQRLHDDRYFIEGKAPNKEEFVTCGGVSLKEINFKTMESAICPGLFFAGEILDIDGLTGGFNLQSAWTTGFIAGSSAL